MGKVGREYFLATFINNINNSAQIIKRVSYYLGMLSKIVIGTLGRGGFLVGLILLCIMGMTLMLFLVLV